MLKIGLQTIIPGLALAPMAGVTNRPFRLLARRQGCQIFVSEMISAKGLLHNNQRNTSLFYFEDDERPIGLQLFGSDPVILAAAAARLEELAPDFIDLNFGCPTKKITRNGDGGALMRNPKLCSAIFSAVVKAVKCPVTVKIRKGWDENSVNASEIAARAEEAGLAAVTVHGRTVAQGYSGQADWQVIREVAENVTIPVIGNGDVVSASAARKMYEICRCSGVMVGRAARGNPWIFAQLLAAFEGRPLPEPPSKQEIINTALEHFALLINLKGKNAAAREMRRHAAWYIKGLPGAAQVRQKLICLNSYNEAESILREFAGQLN